MEGAAGAYVSIQRGEGAPSVYDSIYGVWRAPLVPMIQYIEARAPLVSMIRYNMEGAPGAYDSIEYIDKSHPLSSCDVILITANYNGIP